MEQLRRSEHRQRHHGYFRFLLVLSLQTALVARRYFLFYRFFSFICKNFLFLFFFCFCFWVVVFIVAAKLFDIISMKTTVDERVLRDLGH